jgi:hypothetical protein
MNTHIYKIEFDRNSYNLNEDYERLSEYEKEKISDLDAESFFDFEKDDNYSCFVITTPIEIKKYTTILTNNLIMCDCQDISQDVLKFNINLEEELKEQISTINSIKYSFFIDDVDDWIFENLDIYSFYFTLITAKITFLKSTLYPSPTNTSLKY